MSFLTTAAATLRLQKRGLGSSAQSAFIRFASTDASANAAVSADIPTSLEAKEWTKESKRTGVLAMKVGMLPVYDHWGYRHNCTVLQVEECQVMRAITEESDGYTALQLAAGMRKARNVKKPIKGQFDKAGIPTKRTIQEFRVTPDALLPVGTTLTAMHFTPGQYVDVCGRSIGKGFQGVMKRHNFAGQPASHGNSKTHRHAGSTGQCQDPGRVFKGKKMAGRMGNERVTRDNLLVVKVDVQRNLLFVKGSVPGNKGGMIRVTDARKKALENPPFPTYIHSEDEDLPDEIYAPHGDVDPHAFD